MMSGRSPPLYCTLSSILITMLVVFFTLTDRASTVPSNIRGCQSGTWSAGQKKIRGISTKLQREQNKNKKTTNTTKQNRNDKKKGTIVQIHSKKKIEEGHSIERVWYNASREPSDTWSLKSFPSLPGARLAIFHRDASSALLQLVNQWLNLTYSRSHAFRYERKNTNPTSGRIEPTTSALACVQVTYWNTRATMMLLLIEQNFTRDL